MKRFIAGLLASGTLASCFAAAGFLSIARTAQADPPQQADRPHYLFIAPTNQGYGHFVPAQAYAYGWFGVTPTPHTTYHWDMYDHRWIWR